MKTIEVQKTKPGILKGIILVLIPHIYSRGKGKQTHLLSLRKHTHTYPHTHTHSFSLSLRKHTSTTHTRTHGHRKREREKRERERETSQTRFHEGPSLFLRPVFGRPKTSNFSVSDQVRNYSNNCFQKSSKKQFLPLS